MSQHTAAHSMQADDRTTTIGRTSVTDFVLHTNYKIESEGGSLSAQSDRSNTAPFELLTRFIKDQFSERA